jgi:phage-related minor tail protein
MRDDLDGAMTGFRSEADDMRRQVAMLREEMGGPLIVEAERAGQAIERALVRGLAQGKLGFEDLKRTALAALAEIAQAAVKAGVSAIFSSGQGGGGSGGGILGAMESVALAYFGAPGRATGGPVSGGRAYMVGERGPELFVPTASGRVEPMEGGARHLSITVNVAGSASQDPQRLAQSGRQLARAVRRAVMQGDG